MNSQIKSFSDGVIEPARPRGAKTQLRLVKATLKLLKNRSFEEISVAGITQAAGLATGTFYRRFKSKEALLPLLYDAYDDLYADWSRGLRAAEIFDDADLATCIEAIVSSTADFYQAHRGLIRALHLNSRMNAEIVTEASTARRAAHIRSIEELPGLTALAPKTRRRIAQQISLVMVSTLTEYILYPECTPADAVDLSVEDIAASIATMAAALLEKETPARKKPQKRR